MCADIIENYVPRCRNVMWSNLDSNQKENNLFVVNVNARSISSEISDEVIKVSIVRKKLFIHHNHRVLAHL